MNLKFVVNDYVLIWNLLFQASISENIHKLKQKLWINYKNEYNDIYKDKELILKDIKNFIPNDDTVYNIVLEDKEYEKIKKETEKYRNDILRIWDKNKKEITKSLKELLRLENKNYTILVVDNLLDIVDSTTVKNQTVNTLVYGKRPSLKDKNKVIIDLVFEIFKKEIKNYQKEYKDIVMAVAELAILNELATRLNDRSTYLTGDLSLNYLKRQIYPYWLMYLGATKEEMLQYMVRDKIAFNIEDYTYEHQLKKLDIFEFINFCIRNQKHIVKINELEII